MFSGPPTDPQLPSWKGAGWSDSDWRARKHYEDIDGDRRPAKEESSTPTKREAQNVIWEYVERDRLENLHIRSDPALQAWAKAGFNALPMPKRTLPNMLQLLAAAPLPDPAPRRQPFDGGDAQARYLSQAPPLTVLLFAPYPQPCRASDKEQIKSLAEHPINVH